MRFFTRLSCFLCAGVLCFILSCNTVYAADDLPNNPPEDPPWYGGYYITGYSAALGNCTIYIPVAEGWCLDQYGFLFRYASNSVSGKLYTQNGRVYDFNAPAFSQPRYRESADYGYNFIDLQFNPSATNVVIENSFELPHDDITQGDLLIIAALGFILVFMLSRRG